MKVPKKFLSLKVMHISPPRSNFVGGSADIFNLYTTHLAESFHFEDKDNDTKYLADEVYPSSMASSSGSLLLPVTQGEIFVGSTLSLYVHLANLVKPNQLGSGKDVTLCANNTELIVEILVTDGPTDIHILKKSFRQSSSLKPFEFMNGTASVQVSASGGYSIRCSVTSEAVPTVKSTAETTRSSEYKIEDDKNKSPSQQPETVKDTHQIEDETADMDDILSEFGLITKQTGEDGNSQDLKIPRKYEFERIYKLHAKEPFIIHHRTISKTIGTEKIYLVELTIRSNSINGSMTVKQLEILPTHPNNITVIPLVQFLKKYQTDQKQKEMKNEFCPFTLASLSDVQQFVFVAQLNQGVDLSKDPTTTSELFSSSLGCVNIVWTHQSVFGDCSLRMSPIFWGTDKMAHSGLRPRGLAAVPIEILPASLIYYARLHEELNITFSIQTGGFTASGCSVCIDLQQGQNGDCQKSTDENEMQFVGNLPLSVCPEEVSEIHLTFVSHTCGIFKLPTFIAISSSDAPVDFRFDSVLVEVAVD